MRVAYVVSEYPAISHSFVMREVRALRDLGVEVHPFSIRRTPPDRLLSEADREEDRRTHALLPTTAGALLLAHAVGFARSPRRYARTLGEALRLGPPGARNRLWQAFYFAEAMLLRRELRRRRVEHVHAHFAHVSAWVTMLAALYEAGRLSWSFTMHGPTEFDDVGFHRLAEKARRADFVACISDYARSQLMKQVDSAHWGKLEVVHCGLRDVEAGPPAARSDAAAGRLRVLSVGRLVADKGAEILLEAVAAVRARGLEVELTLVGDGPLRERLDARAARDDLRGAVKLTGPLGVDRVQRLYREHDAFCLPSFAEGVPVVLMEAMAAGRPVVTTRIMGIPELVEDGVSGFLVAPGRVAPVADALAALAADPGRREAMGSAGREAVRRGFLVADSARQLERHFAAAVAARGSAPGRADS
jgi:glycosyltransferase involved in cell wall biosynthesis